MIEIAGDFTYFLYKEVKPIYKKMVIHPFSKGLQKGSLSKKAFKHYLSQDILYLKDDAKAFLHVSKRVKSKKQREFFSKMQKDMIAFEKIFDKKLSKKFKVTKAKSKSKVIRKYTSFLLQTSKNKPVHLALSALLPCFWIYSAVGLEIEKNAKKKNPYKEWIDFYRDKEVIRYVNIFIKIVENHASNLPKGERAKMKRYFLKSSKYELSFFDEAMQKGKS